MGISITSDLVMDVMRAAEPRKLAMARQKLGGTSAVADLDKPESPQLAARAKAHQEFEAAMLRTFTEQMMPKQASSLYGDGTAGNIWRSLQVDLMSQQMAKAGGIGIAKMLDRVPTATAPDQTAQTLGLNEISGGTQRSELLSSAAQWPYFNAIVQGDA